MSRILAGFDVGGSSIKAAPVDVDAGALAGDLETIVLPAPSTPDAVVAAISASATMRRADGPIGLGFPSVIQRGVACTEEARSSVTVSLVDDAGAAIPAEAEPVVEYAVDGGAAEPCDSIDGASFVCGYEVAGELTISASASGFAPASEVVEVPMTADGCHVESQSLTLALSPA